MNGFNVHRQYHIWILINCISWLCSLYYILFYIDFKSIEEIILKAPKGFFLFSFLTFTSIRLSYICKKLKILTIEQSISHINNYMTMFGKDQSVEQNKLVINGFVRGLEILEKHK